MTVAQFEHMFEHMTDTWTVLHRRAAELLHAIVLWNPGPGSPPWQAMCPPIARLTKVLMVADVLDESGAAPIEPVWRTELLAAAADAGAACARHYGDAGVPPRVAMAAQRVTAAVAVCSPRSAELVARAS